MGEQWRTKADVMKDLAAISGANYIDDRYIVIGNQKPQHVVAEEEDLELDERYRDAISSDFMPAPNYNCITEMLRQVDAYHDQENPQSGFDKVGTNYDTVYEISKISNLNPNCEEFMPNTLKEQPYAKKSHEINDIQLREAETGNKKEIIEKAMELRAQISEASKDQSIKAKTTKNVAISSLLKLYSRPQNVAAGKETVQPKLMTPEAFDTSKVNNTSDKLENEVKEAEKVDDCIDKKNILESLEKVNCWLDKTSNQSMSPNSMLYNRIESTADETRESGDSNQSKSPSIGSRLSPKNKVDPDQYLSSGMFKKKLSKKSSNTNKETNTDDHHNNHPKSNAYVPSTYADTLLQKYAKKKEREYQQLDIWSKLEHDLKEKDKKIREKKNKTMSSESQSENLV